MVRTVRNILWTVIGVLAFGQVLAQPTAITLINSPYTQDFNSIASGVPSGWAGISGTTGAISTSTVLMGAVQTPTLTATAWSNTGSGFFNYASAIGLTSGSNATAQSNSTNRAFGFQATGSNDSLDTNVPPNATGNGSYVFRIANTLGYTNMSLSLSLQQLNNGTGRSIRVIYQVASGNDPNTLVWKTITSTGTVNAPGHLGYFSNTVSNNVWGANTVSFTSAQLAELENKSTNVWFRILMLRSTGSGTRPKIAIDNFSLSWTSTPSKVALSNVIPSTPNTAGTFSVVASILNSANGPAPVASTTAVTLSVAGGAGTLGGTLTRNITSSNYQVTFTGLSYNVAESIVLNASASGLTTGTLGIDVAPPPAAEPTGQATSATVSGNGFNTLTVNFSPGNGNRRIVVARQSSAVSATPQDGFGYSANANFGQGSELSSGQFVVYDGTGSSATVNLLNQGTTYHFAVFEYNTNGNGTQNYLTTTPAIANGATTSQSLTLGDLAIVGFRGSTPDGLSMVALVDIAGGTQVKITDNSWTGTAFIVGETVWTWTAPLTGVSKGTVIRLEGGIFSIGTVSGGTITGIGNTGDNLFLYTGADATPNFIYGIANQPFITTGTATASNSYLPSALTLGTTAVASATNFFNGRYSVTSICSDKAGVLASVSNISNWLTSVLDDAATISITPSNFNITVDNLSPEPTANVTITSFSGITPGGMTINWINNPNTGTGRLVIVREGAPVSFIPADGIPYTANSAYGSGQFLGSNQYVLYSGTASSVTVTSMAPGTNYHFAIFSYDNTGCINYRSVADTASKESGPGPGTYYSKTTGFLNDPSNWGDNTDGTLSDPLFALSAFTVPNRQYVVNPSHPSATINGNWVVSGLGARVVVPNGATFTIPNNFTLTNINNAATNVNSGGTLVLENATAPTYGTLQTNSTVVYNHAIEAAIPTKNMGAVFGNLTLSGAGRKIFRTNSAGDTTIVMGNLTFNNVTYNTATSGLNSTRIRLGGDLTITGTVTRTPGSSALDANQSNNGYPNIICNVNGTNQTLSGNFANDSLSLFSLIVNKSSGSVTFGSGTRLFLQGGLTTNISGTASFADNGIDMYVTGNVQLAGGSPANNLTGTIHTWGGNGITQLFRGSTTSNVVGAQLNNVRVSRGSNIDFNGVAPSGVGSVTFKGNLTILAGSTGEVRLRENNYTFLGNFVNNRTSASNITQTNSGAKFTFSGTSAQTFSSASNNNLTVSELTIANTGGDVTASGLITCQGDLTLNSKLISNGALTVGNAFGVIEGTNTTSSFRKLTLSGPKEIKTTIAVLDTLINNVTFFTYNANGNLFLGIGAVNGYLGGSSNNFEVNNLTSVSGSNWFIDRGLKVRNAVNVNGAITSDSGSLTLAGGPTYQGYVAPITSGSLSGKITLEKWANPANANLLRGAYYLLAHPFTSMTYKGFDSPFNPMVGLPGTSDPNNPSSSVWLYDVAGGWNKPSNINNSFPVASGAYVFLRGPVFTNGGRFSISGTPNVVTSPIDFPVSYSGVGSYNLLGNPLPAAIDWNSASISKTALSNTIYYWRQNILGYASYTIGGGSLNGGSNIIPSGQGFFVEATSGSAAASITSENAKVNGMGTFLRAGNSVPQFNTKIAFKAAANAISDETIINFIAGASDNFSVNEPDGRKMLGTLMNLSTVTPMGENMAVNSRSIPTQSTTVPLNVTSKNSGSYSLNFDDLANLPQGMLVYLEDNYTNSIQPIYPSMVVNFTIDANPASQGANRFRLVFSPQLTNGTKGSLTNGSVNVFPNPSNGDVSVALAGINGISQITVSDVMGRVVKTLNLDTQTASVAKLNGLAAGTYLVKVASGAEVITKKLVVE